MESEKRIAFFVRTLDLVFLKKDGVSLFPIFPKDSEEERIVKRELKFENFLPIELKRGNFIYEGPEKILKYSNLLSELEKNKIDYIFLTRISKKIKKFLKGKIKILGDFSIDQKKFENKIFFERFLKRNNLSSGGKIFFRKIKYPPFKETVIQLPESSGGEGTFLAKSKSEFEKIMKKINPPFLIRKYFRGIPLGISFLVGKEIYFSAICRQCLDEGKNFRLGIFRGLQWLPFDFFPKKILEILEEKMKRISHALKKEGYFGWINIDFILEGKKIHFLEANPRTTAATPQIFSFEELNGGVDFLELFLNKNAKFKGKEERVPKSNYQGAFLYLDFEKAKMPKFTKNIKKGGFYKIEKNGLKKEKLKNRFDFLGLKNFLFFYNELEENRVYWRKCDNGSIISNFPLFDFEKGHLTEIGKKVFDFFEPK